ncbi:hypothetical protein GpartN1_g4897.t1 [Galdieria partita]|uniref:Uncharacterized protein n=1 Tax=Galdieria partita TaxID=83374 RepID=A0A9C7URR3_9RHOD|nr:hypothetical protein GpartN1_g4897.t1 [Galdieria partita]
MIEIGSLHHNRLLCYSTIVAFHFRVSGFSNPFHFSSIYTASRFRTVFKVSELRRTARNSFARKLDPVYVKEFDYPGNFSKVPRMNSTLARTDVAASHSSIKRYEEGPLFNHMVTYNDVAYLAGQVASDTSDQTVKGQANQIFARIDQLLEAAGTDKTRLLSANVWLKDIQQVAEFNEAWNSWIDPSCKPVRATVEAKLVRPELVVEVQVTAALPRKLTPVQTSLAAAAVGPYHQGILLENGMIYVSGCIGLHPETGTLIDNTVEGQAKQALSNMKHILRAAGATPERVTKTLVLLKNIEDFERVNEIYKSFFSSGTYPSRSCFAVKELPKGALVEFECVAQLE